MESRPPVSLDGWSGEDRAPDVLDSEREPRLTPAARRRLRLGSVVIIGAIAAVAGGLEVQERRDAAVEERRLAGVLQLSLPESPFGLMARAERPAPQSVQMDMRVLVRNDGPRDVTVTDASAGGFVLLGAPVPLPAQTTVELAMQQKIQCSVDAPPSSQATPGPLLAPGPLQITARTSRGTRTITIARPPYNSELAAETCALMRNHPPPGDVTVMPR